MSLSYDEKKDIVLKRIQKEIDENMESEFYENYIPPEVIFSTTQGSVYLDSSEGVSPIKAKKLYDLKGRSLRFKHIKDNIVDHGYIDMTAFISQEDANEFIKWMNEDIGPYSRVIGREFDPNNTTKTMNVSFIPKEGLIPIEWVVYQDRSSNIKLDLDSKNPEKSKISFTPVYSEYVNGEVVSEKISSQFIPSFHIGHPIKEVFKEKNYFFDAVMVQSLSEKEFSEGEHYNIVKNSIDEYTYPKEDYEKFKKLKEEKELLYKFMDSMTDEQYFEKDDKLDEEIKKLNIVENKILCPKGISDNIMAHKLEKDKSYDNIEL